MSLVQNVCVSGIVYYWDEAWDFALHNGATEKQMESVGIGETLNSLFERKRFNTRCVTIHPSERWPETRYCIVTDFAVLPCNWGNRRAPRMQITEWTKRVCKALLPSSHYLDCGSRMRQVVVRDDDIPPFVHHLFQRQLAGERIASLSPDQTDYSLFRNERAKVAASVEAARTQATPKPKTHSPRRYLKEIADSRPTSPCPINDRPPRPTRKRTRKAKNPKKPSSNSSDSDADVESGAPPERPSPCRHRFRLLSPPATFVHTSHRILSVFVLLCPQHIFLHCT
ncbi:unnamed protein product [Peniophora sp. CBMAI 1063]|nr:unnamed protein product [Peniophora sp. CBMAI 1063]